MVSRARRPTIAQYQQSNFFNAISLVRGVASIDLLHAASQRSRRAGSEVAPWIAPTIGAVLGGVFAAAHRAATIRIWKAPTAPLNVVITGGSRGIGRALAREFLASGDNVYIAARNGKVRSRAA